MTSKIVPPGPSSLNALPIMSAIQRDSVQVAMDWQQKYGDVVRFPFFFSKATLLLHPDGAQHVLQKNHQNYDKNMSIFHAAQALLGKGLFTNDGPSWLKQRRLIQPAFHKGRLSSFGRVITSITDSAIGSWQGELDIQEEMTKLILQINTRTLFDVNLESKAADISRMVSEHLPFIASYFNVPFPPLSVPTPRNRRVRASIHSLQALVNHMILERKKVNLQEKEDLLSWLIEAQDEGGQVMSDQQVLDEVLTLLLGGYESTAETLAWTWYLLSQNPQAEEKLYAELDQVLGGRLPGIEDLPRLTYTTMVIQESLRLYPPSFALARHVIKDDEIGGFHIPGGSVVIVCSFVTQRHPDFWENPESFLPERFAPELTERRHRFAYLPFGGGPRQCIGSHLAMMEVQLILATIAQRYRLQLIAGRSVQREVLVTMRIRDGLPMALHPRRS